MFHFIRAMRALCRRNALIISYSKLSWVFDYHLQKGICYERPIIIQHFSSIAVIFVIVNIQSESC